MHQVREFFNGFFSTSEWPPRWKCGYWSDFHGWLYIVSELAIWASYFLIPLIILNYIRKKNHLLQFNTAYIYFAAFILLCGSTHLLDALMFWVPMYRLNALLRFATAVVSVLTVYHLIKILPQAFRQKTNVELEKEISLRKVAERDLEEANKGLEAFAYMASHDLQEPLRKIRIFMGKLVETGEGKFDENEKQWAEKVMNGTDRMSNLINDVLTLSSLKDGAELFSVNTVMAVNNALDLLEIKIRETGADIQVGNLPAVTGNQGYLTQLFLNLVGNAIKFSKGKPVISISGEAKEDSVFLYVTDNGIGMKPENTIEVFEAFHRLNSKSEYEGSGIGLSICKRIVDIHKGSISVKSAEGEGSTFTIVLPGAEEGAS